MKNQTAIRNAKILFVDDLEVSIPLLSGMLASAGYTSVTMTKHPQEACELHRMNRYAHILNGTLVGFVAGTGMYPVVKTQQSPKPVMLAVVVQLAVIGSCAISGVCGAILSHLLTRLGADPVTAPSIFQTTASDVASMGMLLVLATLFVK